MQNLTAWQKTANWSFRFLAGRLCAPLAIGIAVAHVGLGDLWCAAAALVIALLNLTGVWAKMDAKRRAYQLKEAP